MGNLVSASISAFGDVIAKIFGSPLDFLSGKSCSTVCGTTWDLMCYVENFCVAHLLKLAMVALLFYFVLLFFYLLYKLGICKCFVHIICKIVWACIATWFSLWEYGCYFLCHTLCSIQRKRRRRKRDIEELYYTSSGEESSVLRGAHKIDRRRSRRDYRRDHLRRSLRPHNHRTRVGISRKSTYTSRRNNWDGQGSTIHDISVARTSKFARKSASYRGSKHRRR